MISSPPVWAQSLLPLLVSARDQDSVPGDLLEEYREAQVPARGPAGADRWYVRQVASFLWRACRWWGLALGFLFAARNYLDVTVPTDDYQLRAAITTYIGFSLIAAAGIRAGWRSGRGLSGTLVAPGAALVASIIALLSPICLSALLWSRIHGDPAAYAGLVEGFDVPVPFMFLVGGVIGSIGGGIGKGLSRASSAWRSSIRT